MQENYGYLEAKDIHPERYLNNYGDIEDGLFYRNNQLLCYDPDIRKWTNPKCFGAVPSPRSAHCSTIIREKVWLFGGFNNNLGYLDDFFQLNMHSLTWMQIQTGQLHPTLRCGYTLTATTDNQLILHGLTGIWIMDLTSHSWRQYTSQNHHGLYHHTATLGLKSSVLVIGGCSKPWVYNEIFLVMLEPMSHLFTSVAQHADCSLQTLLFGDPELNHKQNCDIFDAVQHFITLSKRFD